MSASRCGGDFSTGDGLLDRACPTERVRVFAAIRCATVGVRPVEVVAARTDYLRTMQWGDGRMSWAVFVFRVP